MCTYNLRSKTQTKTKTKTKPPKTPEPYPYTTNGNTIYFSHKFNCPLDKYYNVINNHQHLNFKIEGKIVGKFGNVANNKLKIIFAPKSKFNTPFQIPNNLTSITFGEDFNCPVTLTPNLTHISFGTKFNQPFVPTRKLTHIVFDWNYHQPIFLPKHAMHLTLKSAKMHTLNINKNLIFADICVDFVPNPIFRIFIPNKHMYKLYLHLNIQITLHLPKKIFELCLYLSNTQLILPKNIRKLKLDLHPKPFILTPNLTYLKIYGLNDLDDFYDDNRQLFFIEKPIDDLIFRSTHLETIMNNLPTGTKCIDITYPSHKYPIDNLPNSIQKIKVLYNNFETLRKKISKHITVEQNRDTSMD